MARHFNAGVRSHGPKRPADSDPEGDQPLTKKFGCLHIGALADCNGLGHGTEAPAIPEPSWSNESMLLDDTKHTTYIHDLDHELAETEAQEQRVTFLPEIEKRLASIPRSLLTDLKPKNNEIVLYQVPTSLTVPKEQDNVRKAIIESRARAREKQAEMQNGKITETDTNTMIDVLYSSSSTLGAAEHINESMDVDYES